ncbi:putative Metallocarboxypeptidase [Sinomonas atrocyanea]|uniref:Putative Metallocarboxypeptidase n=2 Tax=Sinomonas atrocyanea TaxID=37927 RepID=A0A127A5N0_9MICC|nr:amidohydrolase [Sinomonas atrocyanea]AMM34396.1 putative Metallocarboxypeptidase [Sinomonas atrocyanea]GEB66370.1 peptidase M20 [Sinomonas atrocyanea]GGG60770.1 peptidase M20 [Sinomonas atrocyanea]
MSAAPVRSASSTVAMPSAPAAAALAAEADRRLVELEPQLVRLRRDFHAHPELGFEEHRTAAEVARLLGDLGLSVRTGVGRTGVVGDLEGAPSGPRILVRAELDALPVREAPGSEFAADGSAAHLCGHDAHLAALLGVATVLAAHRDALPGSVRFCFQPAEELLAGAAAMLADGVLDGVDAALTAHVLAALPYGTVAINPGPVLSGADFFRATVSGGAGHAGTPGQYADAVLASAHITAVLQALVARETPAGELLVVGIGSVHGGDAANAAPEDVALLGNVRWEDPAAGARAVRRVGEIFSGVAGALGCRARVEWTGHAPVLANSPRLASAVRAVIEQDALAEIVEIPPQTASDDFAEFSQRVPGLFLGVGCGGPGHAAHHHPRFDIDERAVLGTARILCRALLRLVDL